MTNCVAWLVTFAASAAWTTRLAPGRTTIVRPASALSRRRSTTSSWSPRRSFTPSRSFIGAEMRAPSTHVPWLEPASSITGASPPLPEIRACTRETDGSSSSTVELGARPIVISDTTGTRVRSRRTSSSGALCPGSGAPQLRQKPAPRSSCRRQLGQSMLRPGRQRLEHRVVACGVELGLPLGVLDGQADQAADVLLAVLVGLHDDDLHAVAAPRD